MEASSAARRLLAGVMVRDWAWWRLPWLLRCYVGAVPLVLLVSLGYAITQTTWRPGDLVTFLILLGCGAISVVATPRIAYLQAAWSGTSSPSGCSRWRSCCRRSTPWWPRRRCSS